MSLPKNVPRKDNWLKIKPGTRPTSAQIHPEFQQILASGTLKIIAAGSGFGAVTAKLARKGHKAIGVDDSESEIDYTKSIYHNVRFLVSDYHSLPFENGELDVIITLGLFGEVDKPSRKAIMAECYRVLKPGGYIYVGEFARINDSKKKTSGGKPWVDVYKKDLPATGEYGTVIVHPNKPEKSFTAHHFAEADLIDLAIEHDFSSITTHRVSTVSTISGEKRPGWNAWFQKTE